MVLPSGSSWKIFSFLVDVLEDSIVQLFHLGTMSVHRRWMLWLKCWLVDFFCKKQTERLPFEDERLFGQSLNAFIQKVTGNKSLLLRLKKKAQLTGQLVPTS